MDEEAIEVDHFLVEPQFLRTLDDDDDDHAIFFSSKKVDKSLNVGGILCTTANDDDEDESGTLDADYERIGEQFVDSILQGAAEDENLHAASSFLCDCSGYILGSDFAENSLLDGSRNGDTSVKNVVSASCIQSKEDDDVKSAWLCDVKSPVVCKADQPDLSFGPMDDCGINETFHIAADRYAFIEDSKGLNCQIVFDQPDLTRRNNFSNLMESRLLSSENDDNLILVPGNEMSKRDHGSLIQSSCTGAKDGCANRFGEAAFIELNHQTCKVSRKTNDAVRNTKRLRKPTKRYIEETSELKSRCTYARVKPPLINSKGHLIHAREERKHRKGAMQLLYQDSNRMHSPEFSQTKAKEFEFELQVESSKGYPALILNRRKHHRQWTTSEVVKLVDGVSCYGVGRWTEIKRLLFSASTYRTAVDLKDKWRNLLKSCIAYSENRNLIEPQKKNAAAPIPQSIMRRVRELSVIHPYPRNQKSINTALNGAPVSISGRMLRRQRFPQVSADFCAYAS